MPARASAPPTSAEALFGRGNREIHGKPGHLIRRLQQIAVATFVAETAGFDITPVQYASLLAIKNHPGIDQITLVGVVASDRSTVGAVVERLEAKRLIRRMPDAKDRRSKLLFVTPDGRKLLEEMRAGVESAQEKILRPLTVRERREFHRLLVRIVATSNDLGRIPAAARKGDLRKARPAPRKPRGRKS